jgi:hypothetical protein
VRSLSRRQFVSALPLLGVGPSLGLCAVAVAQTAKTPIQPESLLFENVRIFESGRMQSSGPMHVLLDRSGIRRTETFPIANDENVAVIAGKGRTLIPELIEAHARMMAARPKGEALVEIPEWNYVMLSANSQSGPRKRVPAFEFAERSIKLDSTVDVGIVIAPRIWPKAVVISGLDISQSSIHSGDSQPNRRARLVATAPSACKKVDASQSAAFNPASASYWGAFASVHANTAHAIMTAMPGASGSRAIGSERFANILMVWQACASVSCGSHG